VWKPGSWVELIILFLQICNFLFLPISNKIIFSLDIVDLSCNNPKFYTIDTMRKSAKTNGITDGYNSVSKSVGIYLQIPSVSDTVVIYRWNTFVGIYRPYRRWTIQFFWKVTTVWWHGFFSDDFTDGMTEGFKLGYPYSDVTLSPAESPTGIPTERVRRWFHR
jgi:hypothetical protein